MKAEFLQEPELQFGAGKHIDMKFGLMNYGPLDFESSIAPKKIKLGIVGTPETIEGVVRWIDKCRKGIAAKKSKRPHLFPEFPGFGENMRLCADFVTDDKLQKSFSANEIRRLCQQNKSDEVLRDIAQLFLNEIEYLEQKVKPDVLVCAFPFELVEFLDQEDDEVGSQPDDAQVEDGNVVPQNWIFHDYLKAEAMRFKKPTQIIRPGTYDEKKRLKRKHPSGTTRQLQDEATRAWNLYTALYYKAGGVPWRLVREWSQLDTCYVGISFYKTLDQSKLLTSTAQVFNERGEGVIVREGTARISKDDKQIHLSAEDAHNLLKKALENYRREHHNFPARVVVHKSSIHNIAELEGFEQALKGFSIELEQSDFVSITRAFTRLFRPSRYPPLRGTLFDTDGEPHVLYTKGSVDFFTTYAGLYVPHPLGFRCDKTNQTPLFLAREILALTKMNWNNTQMDGGEPITQRVAQQVGSILKYLGPDYEPFYRFYM